MIPSLLLSVLCLGLPGGRVQPRPPNLLLIIADDMGLDRIGAYAAHPHPAHTPVLDGLAEGGLLFRNVWSQPVCSPTRATILTGRQGVHNGIGTSIPFISDGILVGSGGPIGLSPDELPLPRLLQAAGRRTAAIGKWHLANTASGGYDHPHMMGFGIHAGAIGAVGYFDWEKNLAGGWGNIQIQEPGYVTSVNIDDALTWIQGQDDQPWFLWLGLTSAHKPLHVPPHELLSRQTVDQLSADDPSGADLHRAMVEAMDTELGRLLAGIPPEVLQRTLVIFVGDNGTPEDALEAPLTFKGAKGSLNEGGVHVPMIVAGAGVAAPGREVRALINTVDLYATLLELAGISAPGSPSDSRSFAAQLQDPAAPPARRYNYADKFQPNGPGQKSKLRRALRDERYKLIRTIKPLVSVPNKFYDLWSDPLEQTNLVHPSQPTLSPERQAAFERLLARLLSLET